jgi:hypothetical protein
MDPYIENPGDWPHARQVMSVFKFYQQHAFGAHRHWLHRPLRWAAHRRVAADRYDWPIEQVVMNLVRPQPSLS